MKSIQDSFSVVMAGSWNPGIFTRPEWLIENLAKNNESDIQIAMPLNDPNNNTPRISFDDQHLFVNHGNIRIAPGTTDVGSLKKSCELSKTILTLLKHTPVVALGINFAYQEKSEDLSEKVNQLLTPVDEAELGINCQGVVKSTKVVRKIALQDAVLNLDISKLEDKSVTLSFNFHREILAEDDPVRVLNDVESMVDKYFELTKEICTKVFDLQLDEE